MRAEPTADEADAIDREINGNVVSNEPPLARGRRRRARPTAATQRPAAHRDSARARRASRTSAVLGSLGHVARRRSLTCQLWFN